MNPYKRRWRSGDGEGKGVSVRMCTGVRQPEDRYEGTGRLVRRASLQGLHAA